MRSMPAGKRSSGLWTASTWCEGSILTPHSKWLMIPLGASDLCECEVPSPKKGGIPEVLLPCTTAYYKQGKASTQPRRPTGFKFSRLPWPVHCLVMTRVGPRGIALCARVSTRFQERVQLHRAGAAS